MTPKIPVKLKDDPIIDAVIEVRLKASRPLSDVLPGMLMQELGEGVGNIERLPVSSLPKQVRDNDPNLAYQHLVKVDLAGFSLFVGDRNITLSCVMPYPGGRVFKSKAIEVFDKILQLSFIDQITRLSIKYTDFIEGSQLEELAKYLELKIAVGQKQAQNIQGYNLQLSLADEHSVSLISIITPANVRFGQGQEKKGLILEVDTIQTLEEQDTLKFRERFSQLLATLHSTNKENFFSLLTPHALKQLGATYGN